MKVLFVSSGNSGKISSIVLNQGKSISSYDSDIEIEFFLIIGRGFWGYLRNIFLLRKKIKKNNYNITHAHYSLSAFVASLAGARTLIVSLMGCDVQSNTLMKHLVIIFSFLFRWRKIIVKSEDLKRGIKLSKIEVIPNGVDLIHFKPNDKINCQQQLKWDSFKKNILFAASPDRPEKNYKLTYEALSLLNKQYAEIHFLENISYNEVPIYINASDVLVLSSVREGSPNVIKEAMACNCPVVSTFVGDVKWVIGDTNGCYISSFDPKNFAEKLNLALTFAENHGRTNGRERIIELGLDSESIAKRIINLYHNVLKVN